LVSTRIKRPPDALLVSIPIEEAGRMAATISLIQLSALVGAVLPVVVAIGKQDRFSRPANTLVAVAVALAATLVTVAARGRLSAGNVAVSFTVTYISAVAFHHGLWKPTGVAARVQTRTSVRVPAPPQPPQRSRDLSRC
jgi:hypothetical protein